MRVKPFIILILIIIAGFTSFSQTIYHFKYNFHQAYDTISYQAFFLRHNNGTALVRIQYTEPVNAQNVLVEMQMGEQYIFDSSGIVDSNTVVYKFQSQKILSANKNVNSNTAIAFVFKNDPLTGFSEPVAVIYNDTGFINQQTNFTSTYIERYDLKPSLVKQFAITPDEDFYTTLFPIRTKGASPTNIDTKIFLLIVANVSDKDIGQSCKKDMNKMIGSFNDIADKLNIPVKNIMIKTITGDDYSKKNVEQAINNFIKPRPNKDIVVFYYAGHGFRKTTAGKSSRFPYMDMRSKKDSNYITQSLNIEKDIFDKIVRKGGRLNLVLGDCCNTYAPVPRVEGPKPTKQRGSGFILSEENCSALFMNKKPISILACAADQNQRAGSNRDIGGFFSHFLKNSMENYCSIFEKQVSWKKILDDTKKQTSYKAQHTYCGRPLVKENLCDQQPIVKTIPATLQ